MVKKVVKKKKKGLKSLRGSGTGSGIETSPLRPVFVEKLPPCIHNCPNHNKIREVLMTISKAEDYEKSYDQALEEAWQLFLETTPFPSTCGRVCPHPCESECNRIDKDGGVSINNLERFIGDFGPGFRTPVGIGPVLHQLVEVADFPLNDIGVPGLVMAVATGNFAVR